MCWVFLNGSCCTATNFYFHLTHQESNPGHRVKNCLPSAAVRSLLFICWLTTQLLINAFQPFLRRLLSINQIRFIFSWVFPFFRLYGSLDLLRHRPLWNSPFLSGGHISCTLESGLPWNCYVIMGKRILSAIGARLIKPLVDVLV